MMTLILGGVRSGKTRLAEKIATETGLPVVYLATANAGDIEMSYRINKHKERRDSNWLTIEEEINLASAIQEYSVKGNAVIVDCLTLWMTNLLLQLTDRDIKSQQARLIETLRTLESPVFIVSNETNLGIIPIDALSRRFCDEIGVLHQQLGQIADEVIFMVAGIPHLIKSSP
ncbi:MAG: bifunctional adenosylcobinamide kinase/adenosylcobinamide-phosphate guanylyltransferase [Acidiferrobacteraceae bacterium]|nr:bifunctional adenosylcobinamide kinase/adenosylcobinamide-phosphate guanylyltransferase [Acidiferrobacteraceae bacterium]|tara:strand:- start:110 stop:628 length:519 start_codon:yes stop_codon:yes gene_type:complete